MRMTSAAKYFFTSFFCLLVQASAWAQPTSCAAPGKDGLTYTNPSYYPGNATVAAGATSISLGAIRAGTGAGTTALSAGDLVLVIQMQDAQYNNDNSIAYGDGLTGRGWTNINNAGRYEFRRVVSFAAGTLIVDQGLTFTYTRAAPSAGAGATENGNRRFQVIRVPQFSAVTLAGTLSPPEWNGETGGVWVIDVAGNLNMGGATVDASVLGFRGGGGWPNSQINGAVDYVGTANFVNTQPGFCGDGNAGNRGAAKGEGIAGTPQLIRRQSGGTNYQITYAYVDLGASGYAGATSGGFLARGAPGNAGGGGTQHNAGGGGGSNVGQGGLGGNSFAFFGGAAPCVAFGGGNPNPFNACRGDNARAVGGLGGGTLASSIDRLIMGGGGGAGDSNNACDNNTVPQAAGGNGGGIIFIRAGTISGNGTLLANGQNGLPGGRDAAGGGGAGGTIVVLTSTTNPALTIRANAGQGGNTGWTGSGGVPVVELVQGETQGPAGGGGGGSVVFSSNIAAVTTVTFAGGASGRTFPQLNTATFNTYGSGSGGGSSGTVPFVPTSPSLPNNCLPSLSVSKTTTTPFVTFPATTTAQYVITLSNSGPGTAIGATLVDTLQSPFRYAATNVPVGYSAGAAGPVSPTTGSGTQTVTVGTPGTSSTATSFIVPSSGTVTFTLTVNINGGGTPTLAFPYQNSVTLSFLDPFRTAATTTVSPTGTSTFGNGTLVGGTNYAAGSSGQEDVRVQGSVPLSITKTNGVTSPTAVVAGTTLTYTITVANTGGAAGLSLANAVLRDPPAAGLVCTSVTCVVPGGSTSQCPGTPSLTISSLQVAGITVPLLNSGIPGATPPTTSPNRLAFVVTCGVTATGLP